MNSIIKVELTEKQDSTSANLVEVDKEIDEVFDPYFAKYAGSHLQPYEKIVLRTYLMGKLLRKFGEENSTVPN